MSHSVERQSGAGYQFGWNKSSKSGVHGGRQEKMAGHARPIGVMTLGCLGG